MLNRELNKTFRGFNSSIQYNVVNSTDFLYTFVFPAQIQAGWWWLLLFCAIFSLFVMTGAVQFGPPSVVCLKTHTSGGYSFVSGLRGCWWYLALKKNRKEKNCKEAHSTKLCSRASTLRTHIVTESFSTFERL